MQKKQKGFTIIELIVVIAIIAVLATIVMINVTSYIAKGKDAAIKGNLASVLTNAAVYYETAPAGDAVCADPSVDAAVDAADMAADNATGQASCQDDAGVFCACAPLTDDVPTGTRSGFCVDSNGVKIATAVACATECADYECDGN